MTSEDESNDSIITEYVGFENTVLTKEHWLLVVGKENDLAELVRAQK
jgi:hypothetical protein